MSVYPAYKINDILEIPYVLFISISKYTYEKFDKERKTMELKQRKLNEVPKWPRKK